MSNEVEHNLPGVITSISVQKNNRDRYSIFVDDEFLLGVAEETFLRFNLAKGVEITPSLYQKLQREEGKFAVKSYILKLLGRRDHARKELQTKAVKKDYPKEVIENVLDELEQKGFINDAGFAEKFATEKSKAGKWGPAKIKAHLRKKGISESVAETSIRKAFENEDLKETFLDLVLKRRKRFLREEDPFKRKKKVFDHLVRKGYRASNIRKYLDELMKTIEQ